MENELNLKKRITLIVDDPEHARELFVYLKQMKIPVETFRPGGETSSVKFVFPEPSSVIKDELNTMFDHWNDKEAYR